MSNKVTTLSKEQIAKFPEYVQEWTAYGLSTEPIDKERAKAAVEFMYTQAGLAVPKIVWTGSPLGNALTKHLYAELPFLRDIAVESAVDGDVWSAVRSAVENAVGSAVESAVENAVGSAVWRAVVKVNAVDGDVWGAVGSAVWRAVVNAVESAVESAVGSSVGSSVESAVDGDVWSAVRSAVENAVGSAVESAVVNAVWSAVGSAVWRAVESAVWGAVGSAVRSAVENAVGSAVWRAVVKVNAVGSSVESAVWRAVRDKIENIIDALKKPIKNHIFDSCYGQHDASWLAYYAFFRHECGLLSETEPLTGLFELCKSSGWILPFEGICFVSDRPYVCKLVNNRLHCEEGPALAYRDGFEIYALNGVQVPKEVVMSKPEELDPALILAENYEGFSATHEIRSEVLKKIGAKRVLSHLNAILIEKISGEELYRQYPIAEYVQQGDVLLFPCDENGKTIYMTTTLTFDTMDGATKIRLRNGVFYELYHANLKGVDIRMLRMGNPSVDGEEHIEYVHASCMSVYEAILFRNYGKLPEALDGSTVGLPSKLS